MFTISYTQFKILFQSFIVELFIYDFIYYLLFENKSNLKINRNLFTLQLTKMVKLICIKGRYVKVDTKTFLHASHVVCLIENKSALTFDAGVSKPTMSIVMRIMKINID